MLDLCDAVLYLFFKGCHAGFVTHSCLRGLAKLLLVLYTYGEVDTLTVNEVGHLLGLELSHLGCLAEVGQGYALGS